MAIGATAMNRYVTSRRLRSRHTACLAAIRSARRASHVPVRNAPASAAIFARPFGASQLSSAQAAANTANAMPVRPAMAIALRILPSRDREGAVTGTDNALHSRLSYSRRLLVGLQIVLRQPALENLERRFHIVGELEQLQILFGDHAVAYQCVEVQNFFPK